ncbi:Na+/H+ antiporter NhaC family protein [Ruminococcus sp. AF25-13]|jgi:tetracycline resistance efflux pump|nr:Na+/H+ antiporter NhaC family protein [Ruminococcus sp. TF10-6]RGF77227.1 Na+/H+ antiporter NhaC family protein [Ruminococcus sp. AF31-14BH]RGG28170.1 Na+/H+ antiporter NhaC family protein [Ruminococcus sp. AF25-13]RGG36984.1 Na+/H+ antiporter NhaC family protein [Ruminococcus sp. AF24-16]RGG57862.1 Na+/H+ antiporter NhaC family protein [Ruminococcus sp. AF19-4LB]RGH72575.1 Na+/H+ antiporter NhaC family protein [Ruminococcus sp. AM29-5AC]RGH76404.1 Na+/H+ antiporter NhaC family protein [Ru
MRNKRKMGYVFLMSLLILCCSSTTVFAADTSAEYVPQLYATIWSLVPPVVAIVLALITKEVYSSLFVGILIGGAFWSGFKAEATILHVFQDGVVGVLTDSYNMGILVFLVILGVMVCMMNKAGGSAAFGRWAKEHIKTRAGAQLATIALGVLIFIDDYFNCLTVGSVMRPVTDSHNVSRAKLAYLIDATAAPICIIAPISSWAAAVTGFVKGEDGFSIFIRAIPYNYYAILTIIMMVTLVLAKEDYGPMKAHEKNAIEGDLFTTGDRPFENATENAIYNKGKVIDLVFPILSLIVCCVIGMIYSGGFFSGTGFVEAFSGSDASVGLMLGSFFAMVITIVFYAVRKVLRFSDSMACIPEGFKAMVPAILILTFAWTLKAMTDSLGAAPFVASVMNSAAGGLMNLLPAIIFLVGCFLAFATGTSWGTFGILIPIVVAVFQGTNETMMIISISACMAGAVCGDHCSPISDTTIMASAGAQCNHVNHVSTQLPYAMTVAAVSCITYVIAGILQNAVICLVIGIALQIGVLLAIKAITKDHTGRVKTTN